MKYLFLLPLALLMLVACDKKEEPVTTGLLSTEDIVGTWAYADGGEFIFPTYNKGTDTTIANTASNLQTLWGITIGESTFNADGSYTSKMSMKNAAGEDSLVQEVGTWKMAGDTVTFDVTSPTPYTLRYLNTAFENGQWSWKSLDPYDYDGDGETDDHMSGVSRKVGAPAAATEAGHE